jgi:NAD(P)-dependent dehydrogenase (short-subunit alcohol dehydrogenase family)
MSARQWNSSKRLVSLLEVGNSASDTKAVSSAVDQVEKELGPIRVLVNVQGIIGSRPVVMENYENYWKTMEINNRSVIPPQACGT